MKNIIKQIEKIKGVVTVEKAGENMAVVVFEPRSQKVAVKCTDQKQFEFVWNKTNKSKLDGTEFLATSSSNDGNFDSIDLEQNSGMQDSNWFKSAGYKVITFGRYLDDYSLRNEWDTLNKHKSLSPEELVDGKIYVSEDNGILTFRFKSLKECVFNYGRVNCYSFIGFGDYGYRGNDWVCCTGINRNCRHATTSEAQSLIRAEIANNFFFELK